MAHNYETVKYSRSRVKRAGKRYVFSNISHSEKETELAIINNWRAAHAFPLQIIYMHLKKTAPDDAIVAQRLKRLYSITQKLARFPHMSLTSMQDIGGCRVIVNTVNEVYDVVSKLKKSRMRHGRKEDYDYIAEPKDDGYRSYHLVLSYQSDRNPTYNGLFIEIQIRTHLQHVWATAVETMDTFTGDPLKIGKGSPENRAFFEKVSRLFEDYEKADYKAETIKGTESQKALLQYSETNSIIQKLKTIQKVANFVASKTKNGQGYYVLRLDHANNQLTINNFERSQHEEATEYYDLAESQRSQKEDVVLVSTASFSNLQQAYPNYFTDVSEFLDLLSELIG